MLAPSTRASLRRLEAKQRRYRRGRDAPSGATDAAHDEAGTARTFTKFCGKYFRDLAHLPEAVFSLLFTMSAVPSSPRCSDADRAENSHALR